jgi:hypothetical protein
VLLALAAEPLSQAEIKTKVAAGAKPLVKAALADLVKERAVLKHPKLGRRLPFGLGPPRAADYLPAELAGAFKRLMKLGFEEEELQRALRRHAGALEPERVPTSDAAAILAAMSRLNNQASRGALVYVSELRASLVGEYADKESFDQAVLTLAKQGKVQLQAHAWPGRLSEEERDLLVPDGRGGFFDAIGLRLE